MYKKVDAGSHHCYISSYLLLLSSLVDQALVAIRHKITRDDLTVKAISVLQQLLPRFWRASRCRHRLRVACLEEQPWRAEANILTASCYLDQLLTLVSPRQPVPSSRQFPTATEWMHFAVAGNVDIGSIPSHTSEDPERSKMMMMMQLSNKPLDEMYTSQDLEKDKDSALKLLRKMLLHLQRAVVCLKIS